MDFRKRIRFVRWFFFSKHKKQECAHAAREFSFVFSQKETKRAAGSSPRPPHGPAAAVSREPRPNPFGEPSQTRCACAASAYSPAFQTHGKARFLLLRMLRLCAATKNPLTSHAVRCYKCCLGLPLAFCAAFRCSLRWRFTTRLFVHVFLPFGFFDKLCFKHFV